MVIFIRDSIETIKKEITSELFDNNEKIEKKGLKYKKCIQNRT